MAAPSGRRGLRKEPAAAPQGGASICEVLSCSVQQRVGMPEPRAHIHRTDLFPGHCPGGGHLEACLPRLHLATERTDLAT